MKLTILKFFPIKSFLLHDQKVKTKIKISWERKDQIKSIFHHFKKAFIGANNVIFWEGESPTLSQSVNFYSAWNHQKAIPANISCFPRRLEDVLKTIFLLQEVFSRRLPKTSSNYVLKRSWKTRKCYTEDVFKTSSVCLHQDKSLLG